MPLLVLIILPGDRTNRPNLEPATTRSLLATSSSEPTLDPKLDPVPKTGYLAKPQKQLICRHF